MLSYEYYIGVYLIRLEADGVLDSSFGNEGKLPIMQYPYVSAMAIEVDSANRILVYAKSQVWGYGYWTTAVYRFLKNGAKDSSFGDNGKTVTEMINANRAMIIQDDGKILVGGQDAQLNAMIERLNIDGSIDTGFNSGQSRDGKKLHLSVGVLTDRKQINLKWLVRSRAIKESWWWRGNM